MAVSSHLTDCVKTIRVINSVSAGTTDADTSVVDMSGYDAARFIWLLGDVTVNSVVTATMYGNSASSTSSPTPTSVIATTAYTATATDADNKALITDCITPANRYVFGRLTRTAANAVIDGCICELYRARSIPITADSTVLAQAKDVEGGVA